MKDFATDLNGNGYPMVRKWFVEQFPNFRKNPMFYLNNSPGYQKMRVDNTKDKEKKKKDKKRQQSIIEKEILSIMSKSMKTALDMALDDLLKDWK